MAVPEIVVTPNILRDSKLAPFIFEWIDYELKKLHNAGICHTPSMKLGSLSTFNLETKLNLATHANTSIRVNSLTVCRASLSLKFVFSINDIFSNLNTLRLQFVTFQSELALHKMLNGISNIQNIQCSNIKVQNTDYISFNFPKQLKNIIISQCNEDLEILNFSELINVNHLFLQMEDDIYFDKIKWPLQNSNYKIKNIWIYCNLLQDWSLVCIHCFFAILNVRTHITCKHRK